MLRPFIIKVSVLDYFVLLKKQLKNISKIGKSKIKIHGISLHSPRIFNFLILNITHITHVSPTIILLLIDMYLSK